MKSSRTTLGIVDNDSFALHAMSAFLTKTLPPEFEIVCLLSNPQQAIARWSNQDAPDILLVDMSLGDIDGAHVIRKIREHNAKTVLLAVTSFPIQEYTQDTADAGAQGIVGKSDLSTMVTLIKQIVREKMMDCDGVHFDDARNAYFRLSRSGKNSIVSLSPRENDIIELCSTGNTTSEVAKILEISEATVNTHLHRACEKLKARNRTHLVMLWMQAQRPRH